RIKSLLRIPSLLVNKRYKEKEKGSFSFSLYLLFTSNEGIRNSDLIRRFRITSRGTRFIVSNFKFWLKEYNRGMFK
ncbi:hypothetical protein PSZ85_23695, partial [Shigella sonnei]|nr:hypothetical protein [Shigella sonnei]MDD0654041.1 hypothetical protein [Shigella sonnei]